MKAISIRQPWASLTAAGLRDIDLSNRTTNYRGPVLLVASSRRVGRDFGHDIPTEWYCRVRNAQALGLIPYDEELPVSCVVGVARLEDCTTEMQDSPWSAAGCNWVLRDARMLRTPIYGVKGKQGLFDIPEIDEDALQDAMAQPSPMSSYQDGTLSLSMTEEEMERQLPGLPLVLTLCGDGLTSPFIEIDKDGYSMKPLHQLVLSSPLSTIRYRVTQAQVLTEEIGGRPIQYVSIDMVHAIDSFSNGNERD